MMRGKWVKSALLCGLIGWSGLMLSCSDNSDDPPNPSEPGDEVFSPAVDIGNSEIPYVVVNTDGVAIENEPKVPATLDIYIEGQRAQFANIGIEFRGSTSYRLSDKKSYGIETWDTAGNDLDDSFFGFPEEEDWILNGHVIDVDNNFYFDLTLMHHYVGYELSRSIGRYASRTEFVELEVNGEYLGVYVFMEKLKRDNERIDITRLNPDDLDEAAVTGGYILKIDKTSGGDLNLNQPLTYFDTNWEDDARYTPDISFRSQYDINGALLDFAPYDAPYHSNQYLETYFLYEYPDADEIAPAQKTYIQDYIHDFETALLTDDFTNDERTYTDYIDVESFVDYFLINELCRNIDAYRLSTFLSKDRGGKLSMGPVWDMNIGFAIGDRIPATDWVVNYNDHVSQDPWMMLFWWPRLLEDPLFREAVKNRWQSLRSGTLSTTNIQQIVDEAETYLNDNGAVERNYTRWALSGVDYTSTVDNLRQFLADRATWMDGEISGF